MKKSLFFSLTLAMMFISASGFTSTSVNSNNEEDWLCDSSGCVDLGGPAEVVWVCNDSGCTPYAL